MRLPGRIKVFHGLSVARACMRCLMVMLALGMIMGMTACGKKPSMVELPPNTVTDNSTRVYPDPATDPKP